MINLSKLTKYFGKLRVLENVDLEVQHGESVAVIGPSGCGKSTLLRLLIRLEDPTAGRIYVDRQDISRLSDEGLIRLRSNIGMVFQSSALFDSMNVYDNVAFALHQRGKRNEDQIRRIVREKLRLVELEGTEDLMPDELSGGMKRRVSIARTLAFDPKIILYDEPTTGLDPITSVTIEDLMIKLSRELKVTSIVVTHVMQTVYRTTKRILMLHDGRFIETGTPEQTKSSKDPIVKKFITGGL
ncbi:MAG: ABC transporter ATP-binding protein [Candidatus Saganbacteria bacterium]|nr:ABC transporter ATP-binding protein [Candidatus Saganbacteria bacterium]